MVKNNSKRRRRSCDLSLQLEVDRIDQLDKEFMDSEELSDLFRQRNALHEQLVNGIPEELKPVLSDYCDIISTIIEHKQKFFCDSAYADASDLIHLLIGKKRIKLELSIV